MDAEWTPERAFCRMTDTDRLTRFPHDPRYVTRLGAAVYAFAYLEWLLVDIIRLLDADITADWISRRTSGQLADKLVALIAKASLPDEAHPSIGTRFEELVDERNLIVHAHPATVDGQQRLTRWSPQHGRFGAVTDDELDRFIRAAEQLNRDANTTRRHLKGALEQAGHSRPADG